MPKKKISLEEKNLFRRYLMWCYKTTKEDLDRIDRYFTQLKADAHILQILSGHADLKTPQAEPLQKKLDEFRQYMKTKEDNVVPKKFINVQRKILQPDYWYLKNRLLAVEKTITTFLGVKVLKDIRALYEAEMVRRILEAREHT